ncbi:pRL2-8 [Streptomyces sp. KN37]|uniref:pRL2-8 n=1 Tax=Streptomyces sp. KN37 TaxID=3090667 RepID=UPI002A74AD49|nr:pRL2-8 [Streptomyces sp. KN37]WPO70221.1 pRL2-8 [Streptomyces sp. KN37]WPO74008.1 pRL2-8 [Streptomyces sp. KN37]
MPNEDRCIPCEQHAELHKGNWLGIGQPKEPCAQCEDHARNGCPDRRKIRWW